MSCLSGLNLLQVSLVFSFFGLGNGVKVIARRDPVEQGDRLGPQTRCLTPVLYAMGRILPFDGSLPAKSLGSFIQVLGPASSHAARPASVGGVSDRLR